jgi:hypothetical protein
MSDLWSNTMHERSQMSEFTNAEKYSPAYGFEPGVVVEIHTYDGERAVEYFNRIGEDYITCTNAWYPSPPDGEYGEGYHPIVYWFDEIKSIRLLSGPWAVWQFAPADSVAVAYDPGDAVPFRFYDLMAEFKHDRLRLLNSDRKYVWMSAPWWWLEARK